jgi:hypothetical protein
VEEGEIMVGPTDDTLLALSPAFDQGREAGWDPMLEEAAASLGLSCGLFLFLYGRETTTALGLVEPTSDVVSLWCMETCQGPVQISNSPAAACGMDGCLPVSMGQDDHILSSDGLLLSPAVDDGSDTSPWSPCSCSVDPAFSPRSVMDMFQVSLSPVSKMGPLGTVDGHQAVDRQQGLASFRGSCRRPISLVLSRPSSRCCRNKRVYTSPVRHSRRIGGRFAAGTPVKQ